MHEGTSRVLRPAVVPCRRLWRHDNRGPVHGVTALGCPASRISVMRYSSPERPGDGDFGNKSVYFGVFREEAYCVAPHAPRTGEVPCGTGRTGNDLCFTAEKTWENPGNTLFPAPLTSPLRWMAFCQKATDRRWVYCGSQGMDCATGQGIFRPVREIGGHCQ